MSTRTRWLITGLLLAALIALAAVRADADGGKRREPIASLTQAAYVGDETLAVTASGCGEWTGPLITLNGQVYSVSDTDDRGGRCVIYVEQAIRENAKPGTPIYVKPLPILGTVMVDSRVGDTELLVNPTGTCQDILAHDYVRVMGAYRYVTTVVPVDDRDYGTVCRVLLRYPLNDNVLAGWPLLGLDLPQ